MTSKERMMMAVFRQKPDRLPVTIHQWQEYHLKNWMNGMDQLDAFLSVGLDASITVSPMYADPSPDWVIHTTTAAPDSRGAVETCYSVATPEGQLTYRRCQDQTTTFFTEHIAKSLEDVDLLLKYWPRLKLDQAEVRRWYDRTGDNGIMRGFVASFGQVGPWQDFVEIVGTQQAILYAMDEPDHVHAILDALTEIKVQYVHEEMPGVKYDLIEHGGGAGSSTVISPSMFREFCVPYDRRITDALHEIGLPVVYHTCGGMKAILQDIPLNGCDASETLSPPGMGGDIETDDREAVKSGLGSVVGLIGGLDQFNILTEKGPGEIVKEVASLFETFGRNGGYICSPCDHFFDTPVENLRALAEAGLQCTY